VQSARKPSGNRVFIKKDYIFSSDIYSQEHRVNEITSAYEIETNQLEKRLARKSDLNHLGTSSIADNSFLRAKA